MAENGEKRSPTGHKTRGQMKRANRGYQARPKQKKIRAKTNAARRKLEKEGVVKKGDGKDVDHKRPISKGGSNARSNLRAVSAAKNRAHGLSKNTGAKNGMSKAHKKRARKKTKS